ncbi:hypothetical protein P389DRAFT_181876 [Cystobasidium minutum MCA 4210]|uniref:uncharacterized protein n=1 Tax=Cystobasidium minutum MCA 4210 TaxID=1397322 RepID=UPI0034CEE2CC|eukprot:jgi/Rhomi1/181876/fgenesh1_pg.8_\
MKLVNLFLRLPLLSSCLLLSPLSQLFNRHCVCQTHLDVQSRSSSTPKKGQTKPMFEMKGDEWVHDSDVPRHQGGREAGRQTVIQGQGSEGAMRGTFNMLDVHEFRYRKSRHKSCESSAGSNRPACLEVVTSAFHNPSGTRTHASTHPTKQNVNK